MGRINKKQHISENYQPIEFSSNENKNGLVSWYDGDFNPLLAAGGCLHQLFENIVEKYPENLAVQFNNETLSYSELNKKANRLARYLKSLGVGADDFIGVLLSRTPDMYVAMLGILKAGAAYVPIDPKYPAERVQFILTNCNAKIIISTSDYINQLNRLTCLNVLLDNDQNKLDIQLLLNLSVNETKVKSSGTAYVIYTSGTTGAPKGVKISHFAVCNLVRTEGKIFGVKQNDKVFQGFSIAFDASVEEIWMAFYSGATIFVGTEEIMQSGLNLSKILNKNKVTVFSTVPHPFVDTYRRHTIAPLVNAGRRGLPH